MYGACAAQAARPRYSTQLVHSFACVHGNALGELIQAAIVILLQVERRKCGQSVSMAATAPRRHAMATENPVHSPHQAEPMLPTTSRCTRKAGSKALAAPMASSDISVEMVFMPSAFGDRRQDEEDHPATVRAVVK